MLLLAMLHLACCRCIIHLTVMHSGHKVEEVESIRAVRKAFEAPKFKAHTGIDIVGLNSREGDGAKRSGAKKANMKANMRRQHKHPQVRALNLTPLLGFGFATFKEYPAELGIRRVPTLSN